MRACTARRSCSACTPSGSWTFGRIARVRRALTSLRGSAASMRESSSSMRRSAAATRRGIPSTSRAARFLRCRSPSSDRSGRSTPPVPR